MIRNRCYMHLAMLVVIHLWLSLMLETQHTSSTPSSRVLARLARQLLFVNAKECLTWYAPQKRKQGT